VCSAVPASQEQNASTSPPTLLPDCPAAAAVVPVLPPSPSSARPPQLLPSEPSSPPSPQSRVVTTGAQPVMPKDSALACPKAQAVPQLGPMTVQVRQPLLPCAVLRCLRLVHSACKLASQTGLGSLLSKGGAGNNVGMCYPGAEQRLQSACLFLLWLCLPLRCNFLQTTITY
jgi:hypothetical protein